MRTYPSTSNIPLPLRIITHNIRYATTSPFPGEVPWPQRRSALLSTLHAFSRPYFSSPATIICLQEVLHGQLLDIQASLTTQSSPDWAHLGVGRDDGLQAGEYAPVFFRTDVWRLLHFETVWLSPTPDVPGSKGWDAASVRIVSVCVLLHRDSGRRVLALNTHLDDQGAVSRREAAKMLVQIGDEKARAWDVECSFLAGDLNSEVSGEAYQLLNMPGSGFVDIRRMVEEKRGTRTYGNEMTFTGFKGEGDGGRLTRIDFIHLGKEAGQAIATVEGYAVLPNLFDDGIYISDHRPVVGDILIN